MGGISISSPGRIDKAADRIAGIVDKIPYTEIRVWFHDVDDMTFKGITIKPNQLPYKIKDSEGLEYTIRMEHASLLKYYDWKLKNMRRNIYYMLRLFATKRIGLVIMEYGNPNPITHISHKPKFMDLSPQGLLIDVKQNRYAAFLKSLIGRGMTNRKLIIIIAVIIIIIAAIYFMYSGGYLK